MAASALQWKATSIWATYIGILNYSKCSYTRSYRHASTHTHARAHTHTHTLKGLICRHFQSVWSENTTTRNLVTTHPLKCVPYYLPHTQTLRKASKTKVNRFASLLVLTARGAGPPRRSDYRHWEKDTGTGFQRTVDADTLHRHQGLKTSNCLLSATHTHGVTTVRLQIQIFFCVLAASLRAGSAKDLVCRFMGSAALRR